MTATAGIESRRWALCAAAADLRGTGYPDLFIANDYGISELFANQQGRSFREIGKQTGIGFAPKSGMNVAFGDIFNQGRFSVYVTNISEEGVLIQGNNLWVPREGTSGDSLKYDNLANDLGVELGGWSFGAQFGDLNNDGNQDLILTNGYVSAAKGTSYWYEFSMVAGGSSTIISDAKNWPPMEGKSLSGYQQKRVWINDGAGHFTDVSQAVGYTDTHDGRGVALVDLWNRGVLDVVIVNQRGPVLLFKNEVSPDNAWVDFELHGTRSNHSAIGAQVRLFWNGQEQLQQVSGGCGYSAQNQRRLHFGVGQEHADREGSHPLVLRAGTDNRIPCRWPRSQAGGTSMTGPISTVTTTEQDARPPAQRRGWSFDNRFLAPVLITGILLVGQLTFGILESYTRTILAIVSSILMELVLARLFTGKWPHPASAYITGISVGILIRSPALWPYVLCSLISITSKYAIRWHGRHLWNPSNLGVSAMLYLAPASVASLSVQWGNAIWPMLVIWLLGSMIIMRLRRFHICATYVTSFLVLSAVRSAITGDPWLAAVSPITGPMYQLFVFFMITDPKTTVRTKWGQMPRGIPGRSRRGHLALESCRPRPLLCAFPGRPGGERRRDLVDFAADRSGRSTIAGRFERNQFSAPPPIDRRSTCRPRYVGSNGRS